MRALHKDTVRTSEPSQPGAPLAAIGEVVTAEAQAAALAQQYASVLQGCKSRCSSAVPSIPTPYWRAPKILACSGGFIRTA
jgi:hypothetical protein